MKIKAVLEDVVTTARLGWHGLTLVGVGLSVMYTANHFYVQPFQSSDFLPELLLPAEMFGAIIAGIGTSAYLDSASSFLKIKSQIKSGGGLNTKYLAKHMTWYCNRQGARTACATYGLEHVFDEELSKWSKNVKIKFLPHI